MSGEQIHAMAKVMQESFHQDKTFLDVDTVEYFVKLLRIGFAAHPRPDSSIAAFEHLASGLYRWDAETKTLIGEGFAKPDTVPCDTCGKPVPDRGAAKSWCSDACYGKSGEALVGKLEALRCTKEHCNAKAHSAGEHVLDKAIAIVRWHYECATATENRDITATDNGTSMGYQERGVAAALPPDSKLFTPHPYPLVEEFRQEALAILDKAAEDQRREDRYSTGIKQVSVDLSSLVGKLEALKPGNIDHVFTRGFEQCQRKAIAIVRQHYTNSPVCKDSAEQCIQTDHAQREISLDEDAIAEVMMAAKRNFTNKNRGWAGDLRPCMKAIYRAIKTHLRTPEPVSVSLEKCEIAHAKASADCAMGLLTRGQDETKYIVKSVLDAAGVPYDK